jgi:hypothetical protein
MPLVREAAASVLVGQRHPLIGNAQFFHAATYRASYNNMHYVARGGRQCLIRETESRDGNAAGTAADSRGVRAVTRAESVSSLRSRKSQVISRNPRFLDDVVAMRQERTFVARARNCARLLEAAIRRVAGAPSTTRGT